MFEIGAFLAMMTLVGVCGETKSDQCRRNSLEIEFADEEHVFCEEYF